MLEICPLGCWGKVFMGRYRFGGTWIQNCLRRVLRKRQASGCAWSPPALQGLGIGESVCTSGAGYWRSPVPAAVSLQHPLLTKLNIVPVGKQKTFKGPRSVFTEQAKRMNLKLRGSKPITSKEIYTSSLIPKRLELGIVYPCLQVKIYSDLISERLNDLFMAV